MGKEVDNHLHT